MLMYVAVAALAAVANAQILRISPAIIGASAAGSQQVIQLGAGGSRGVLLARPTQVVAIKPQTIAVVRPTLVAQPIQVARAIQPAYISAPIEREAPAPYAFAFDSEDEFGTKLGRQESANEQGVVTGQYTLADASGISRIVKYIADENGFRAQVDTNEPGTLTSNPADVEIKSSAQ